LGDDAALAESRWSAVASLLEEEIVSRSDELKERAVRRTTLVVVGQLIEQWTAELARETAQRNAQASGARIAAQAAARLEADAEGFAQRLAQDLSDEASAWNRDMELVYVGRDREAGTRDPALARYRVDRALATMAERLSSELAALAPGGQLALDEVMPLARAVIRAAAWSAPADQRALAVTVARSAVPTLVEALFSLSSRPVPPMRAAGVLRELRALSAALTDALR
jgi:hypothetical protein